MPAAYSKKYGLGIFPWVITPVLAVVLVLFTGIQGGASAILIPEGFQVFRPWADIMSRMHGDITKESLHPDPRRSVDKRLNDFYRLNQCANTR